MSPITCAVYQTVIWSSPLRKDVILSTNSVIHGWPRSLDWPMNCLLMWHLGSMNVRATSNRQRRNAANGTTTSNIQCCAHRAVYVYQERRCAPGYLDRVGYDSVDDY